MTARVLDGAGVSKLIKADLNQRVAALARRNLRPAFGSLMVGEEPDDQWTVKTRQKDCASVGITSISRELPAAASRAEIEAVIDELNADPACTAYEVYQPTGPGRFALAARVDPSKDATGLHPDSLGRLVLGEAGPLPCAPIGVLELLHRHDVPLAGAEVCVIGRGLSAGRPLAQLLSRHSEDATVTVCHTGTHDLAAHVRRSDIVVAAAGVPGLVTADMVKPGATVVDVGLTQIDGKLTGDVAADVYEVAGWVSKNPGGVGPMTRVMLLSNLVAIAEGAFLPA